MTKSLKTKLVVLFASLMLVCVAVLGLNQTLVKANSTYAGLTGTASEVTAEVAIEDGEFVISDYAEIKTVSPNGIRFDTTVKASLLEKLPTDAQFGTLIVPTKILGQTELNLANASAVKANVVYANQYLFDTTEGNEGNGLYKATLLGTQNGESFDDFLREYYDVEISARSFVKYTVGGQEKTAYTNTISWSMAQVAGRNIALADTLGLDPEEVEFLRPIMGAGVQDNDAGVVLAENTAEGYEIDLTEKVSGDILKVYDMEMNDVTNLANGKTVNVTVGANRGEMCYLAITEREAVATMFTVADGKISTASDFTAMLANSNTTTVTGYYVQTNDIDLGETAIGWIVNKINFSGVYDGQGYSILNGRTAGLFGTISGESAVVKNLVLVNPTLYQITSDRVGSIASTIQTGATIDNIYVVGAKFDTDKDYTDADLPKYINTGNSREGLLVGNMYTAGTKIQNCLVVDMQFSAPQYTYAVVGQKNAGDIINTYAISNNYTQSINAVINPEVIYSNYDAFDAAVVTDEFKYINDIDADGYITVGAGQTKTPINITPITTEGVVSLAEDSSITVSALTNKTVSNFSINGVEVTPVQDGAKLSFTKDILANVTEVGENVSVLIKTTDGKFYTSTIKLCTMFIDSQADFLAMMGGITSLDKNYTLEAGYYVQTSDIAFSSYDFKSFGSKEADFTGVYDGQGFTLYGTITTNGLFSKISGTVKNVILVGVTVVETGGVGGAIARSIASTAIIDNVYVIGSIESANSSRCNMSSQFLGALTAGATVTNCLVVDKTTPHSTDTTFMCYSGSTSKASNVYGISSNYTDDSVSVSIGSIVADYSAFASAATLSGFKYLDTDASGNVTVGRGTTKTTIYTAPVGE